MAGDVAKLIRERSLPVSFRGYDRAATDAFLGEIEKAVDALLSELGAGNARMAALEQHLADGEAKEQEITNALVIAGRVRADSERDAKERADEIVRAAQAKADQVVEDARLKAAELKRELHETGALAERARARLKSFLQSLLAEVGRPAGELDSELTDRARQAGDAAIPEPEATAQAPSGESPPRQ
jgi:cell division initiation protein